MTETANKDIYKNLVRVACEVKQSFHFFLIDLSSTVTANNDITRKCSLRIIESSKVSHMKLGGISSDIFGKYSGLCRSSQAQLDRADFVFWYFTCPWQRLEKSAKTTDCADYQRKPKITRPSDANLMFTLAIPVVIEASI